MEIVTPKPQAQLALLTSPAKYKNLSSFIPDSRIQIRLPLRKPKYKPLKPERIKPPPEEPCARPVTTTSDILYLMDGLKFPIPLDMYTLLIKECTELGNPSRAIELHKHMRRSGIRLDLPAINRLWLMNVSVGCFERARQLFDQMFVRDMNSWAVVIAGCVENEEYDEALELFIRMLFVEKLYKIVDRHMGFSVSGILVCVLKACLYTVDFNLGIQIHGWLWKMGYSERAALSSFLIKFYGKMKRFEDAHCVFIHLSSPSTSVWTSRIVNCCSDDNFVGAVSIFKQMGREGVKKSAYTFSNIVKACGKMEDIICGRQVHANVMKLGLESNAFVQCALVDFYGKCGFLKDAAMMFEISRDKINDACCNAMITHYIQHGLYIEATKLLYEMKMVGYEPCESVLNELNFVCGSFREEDG